MANEPIDLKVRTKGFALSVIRLYSSLPKTTEAQIIGKQVIRSGTSVGAHYHEAIRARSPAEFISKIEGSLQELEETTYWLDLLCEAEIVGVNYLMPIRHEADELIAILNASVKTVKRNKT
jgi:four helix bundle protein